MIARALSFVAGLIVARLLHSRDDFEDRLEALEAEADARAEREPAPGFISESEIDQIRRRVDQAIDTPPCSCCGAHASFERFKAGGPLRCDWCMGNCLMRTGEHKPRDADGRERSPGP